MISRKSYVNWIKEAGRGHLVAILSWGSYGNPVRCDGQ